MANVQVANTDAELTTKRLSVEGAFIAEGTIANAAIITLPTTPIDLVAAPGASKRIQLLWADLVADCAGGAYTNIATNNAYLYINLQNEEPRGSNYIYNDTSPTITDLTFFLNTAAKQQAMLIPWSYCPDITTSFGSAIRPKTITASSYNVPLRLILNNAGSGNLTGGNGANTLKYKIAYVIQSF